MTSTLFSAPGWVHALVYLAGTVFGFGLARLFMSQSEPSEEDSTKDRTP